jgi:transcriptional regulator with XRE-family HTH domain
MPSPFPTVVPTPGEVAQTLAVRVRALRLARDWKRDTLAAKSGVSASTIKRFELTGTISFDGFLRICEALDRLAELERLLVPPSAISIAELERMERPLPKRGRR